MAYLDELAAEVQNDPESIGYAAHIASGNDAALLALINGKTIAAYGDVANSYFLAWATKHGQMSKIADTKDDNQDPLRDAALALDKLLNTDKPLNINAADIQQQMGAWLALGKCNQAAIDDLYALGATHISRAEQLWGRGFAVGGLDLSNALLEV
jgi:hypothetical protein